MAQHYTVKPGDTLWAIAIRFYGYGMGWPLLYSANCRIIADPDLIFPGQRIRIP